MDNKKEIMTQTEAFDLWNDSLTETKYTASGTEVVEISAFARRLKAYNVNFYADDKSKTDVADFLRKWADSLEK